MYKVNEVAKIFNISKRTLQYYDKTGLLSPKKNSIGYREYSQNDINVLTNIMIYKELEIPLKEIKKIISEDNATEIIKSQRESIEKKITKYKQILKLINNYEKEGNIMSEIKKVFSEEEHKKYKKEVKETYGNTNEYKESNQRWSSYSKEQREAIIKEGNKIFKEIASLMDLGHTNKRVQEKVEEYKNHITKNFYECSIEIYIGLGNMYKEDERFQKNLNKIDENFADFLSKAVIYYCKEN